MMRWVMAAAALFWIVFLAVPAWLFVADFRARGFDALLGPLVILGVQVAGVLIFRVLGALPPVNSQPKE